MGPTLNLSHHTITGQELSDLLAPITPEVFMAEYWGRKPLFIKGNPAKLEKLFPDGFDRAAFFQAIQKAASAGTPGFYLGATNSPLLPTDEQPTEPFFSISSDQMEAQFDAGASMLSAHLSDTRLAQLAVRSRRNAIMWGMWMHVPCSLQRARAPAHTLIKQAGS